MILLTKEEIDKAITMLDELIEHVQYIAINDLNSLDEHTRKLISAYSLSTDTVASAKYLHLQALKKAYSSYENKYTREGKLIPTMSVSIIKQIAESKCEEEAARYTKAERLNAALSHSLDAIRSLISKGKTELEMTKFTRG